MIGRGVARKSAYPENSGAEQECMYHNTCSFFGAIPPFDYSVLARRLGVAHSHSAIVDSRSSSSLDEREVSSHISRMQEELPCQLAEQA